MEKTEIAEDWNSDQFFDADDEFPFFDCIGNAESEEPVELFNLEIVEDGADQLRKPKHSSENPSRNGLRRRSSLRFRRQGSSGNDSKDSNCESPLISEISQVSEAIIPAEEKNEKILTALKDHEKVRENSDSLGFRSSSGRISIIGEQDNKNSTITSANEERVDETATGDLDETHSSFLVFLAGLVIKAIVFQFSLLVSFLKFPIWFSYSSFMFLNDPFGTSRWARGYLTSQLLRIWTLSCESVSPFIYEQLKGQKSIGKLVVRLGWGLFWSIYVCVILFCFLVLAFVIGGFIVRYLVEEPIQISETLNFDYAKTSPVAYVPMLHFPGISCGVNWKGKVDVGEHVGSRVIPPNHKVQLTISLTLPESEYNRKLGVFQVRVDFLSANGKVTASSSYPCILRFKSQPIRFLETFLKTAPLLAGYSSESQILKFKMRGFTEENEPTACLRVILEQRAEYRPGAGVPEIYAASLVLESKLPLFKRIIWYWKKTIFIWTSMILFMMELMFILVCCRSMIVPRARPRDDRAPNSNSPQDISSGT